MDFLGVRREGIEPSGHPVVEAGADADHDVAAVHRQVGLVGAVHAQHPEEPRVRSRHRAQAHQGQRHRKARHIHQSRQQFRRARTGVDDAAAAIQDRPLGVGHYRHGLFDQVPVGTRFRLISLVHDVLGRDVGAHAERDILRQIDQHRAWPAAAGDVECLVDGARQIGGALHKIVVLGARPGDAGGVALLKGVVADQVGRHLAAEDHQRHAVHQRIGDAGDGVGGAGPGGHDHYSHLAGRSRVTFGSVHGAAFLADQDVANAVLLKQFVVYGENGASGVSEYIRDALIHERLDEDLRTGHLFVRHYKLLLGWRLVPWKSAAMLARKKPGNRPGRPTCRKPSRSGGARQ